MTSKLIVASVVSLALTAIGVTARPLDAAESDTAVVGTISVPDSPQSLAVNHSTHRVYGTHDMANVVSVVDARSHAIPATAFMASMWILRPVS